MQLQLRRPKAKSASPAKPQPPRQAGTAEPKPKLHLPRLAPALSPSR